MPVYSLITLTDRSPRPIGREIGWEAHECVASCRYTVDYLSKTIDGRILFGGRGAPTTSDRVSRMTTTGMGRRTRCCKKRPHLVPAAEGVRFTHTWGGPLGWPRDFMPTMGYDPARAGDARGYTGNGVATANLAGRVLADLIIRAKST